LVRNEVSTVRSLSRANLSEKQREALSDDLRQAIQLLVPLMTSEPEMLIDEPRTPCSREEAVMYFGRALVDFSHLIQRCTAASLHHTMLGDEAYLSGEEHAGLASFSMDDDTHSSIRALSEQLRKIRTSLGN